MYDIKWEFDGKDHLTCIGTPTAEGRRGVPNVRSAVPPFRKTIYRKGGKLSDIMKVAIAAETIERIVLTLPRPAENQSDKVWETHAWELTNVIKSAGSLPEGKPLEDKYAKILVAVRQQKEIQDTGTGEVVPLDPKAPVAPTEPIVR